MIKKPLIILCDDDPKTTGLFKQRHGGTLTEEEVKALQAIGVYDEGLANSDRIFDVEAFHDREVFVSELEKRKGTDKEPNIVLTDIGAVVSKDGTKRDAMMKEVKELYALIEKIRSMMDGYFEEYGVENVEGIRRIYPETPIGVYTGYGMRLFTNEQLLKVADAKGNWIQKIKGNEDYSYENIMLRNMLDKKKNTNDN
jgi:hypothetical protein